MPPDPFLDAIVEAVMEMIQSGEHIPDEILEQIADIINNHNLAVNPPISSPEEAPEIEGAPYPSSNVFGFNYDPKNKQMNVKFMGKDSAESGPVYAYSDVEPNVFEIIKRGAVAPRTSGKNKYHQWYQGKTPSHGASVYALLKEGNYDYKKIA